MGLSNPLKNPTQPTHEVQPPLCANDTNALDTASEARQPPPGCDPTQVSDPHRKAKALVAVKMESVAQMQAQVKLAQQELKEEVRQYEAKKEKKAEAVSRAAQFWTDPKSQGSPQKPCFRCEDTSLPVNMKTQLPGAATAPLAGTARSVSTAIRRSLAYSSTWQITSTTVGSVPRSGKLSATG